MNYINPVNASGPGSQVTTGPSVGVSSAVQQPQSVSNLGPCFVCGKMGHFKKACPVWPRAQSSTSNN